VLSGTQGKYTDGVEVLRVELEAGGVRRLQSPSSVSRQMFVLSIRPSMGRVQRTYQRYIETALHGWTADHLPPPGVQERSGEIATKGRAVLVDESLASYEHEGLGRSGFL
jgi:hypothetical protein